MNKAGGEAREAIIFCPNGHLILDANTCPECGWQRPVKGDVGQVVWGPVELGGPLGIGGSRSFIGWEMIDQVLVFPRNNGGWSVLSKTNGELLWQASLETGRVIREMVPIGEHLFASVNDERDLLRAGPAQLIRIDTRERSFSPVWQGETPSLTPPLIYQDKILLRDAVKGLVVLDAKEPWGGLKQIELENFSPYMPVILNDQVLVCDGSVMHNTVRLISFDLKTYKQRWESRPIGNMVDSFLTADDRYLVFSPNRRRLLMLDSEHPREFAWEKNLSKVYSNPVLMAGKIGVVHRGDKDPDSPGHYLFSLFDLKSGEEIVKHPLGKRGDQALAISDQQVILTGHDRDYKAFVLSLEPDTGAICWEYQFDTPADPIQSQLKADDHMLYLGMSTGHIFALQHTSYRDEVEQDPQVLFAEGKYSEAAAIYALNDDFRRAAQIYRENLSQPEKALILLEKGHLYREAGQLAVEAGWHQRALEYYEMADDQSAQAEVLESMGDHIEAAKKYQALGQHMKAGQLFEQVGDVVQAFRNYSQAQNEDAIKRLARVINALPEDVGVNLQDIERCLKVGLLEEAANLALRIHQLERAVKIFQELGDVEKEINTLLKMAQRPSSGQWIFERLVKLSMERSLFHIQGMAYQSLGKYRLAAEAYERAGDRVLEEEKDELKAAGYLYKAKQCFEDYGQIDEIPRIKRRIIYYKRLPNITVKIVRLDKPLREEDTNFLTLEIANDGFGIANDIVINIRGEGFDFQQEKIPIRIKRLAPNLTIERQVFLKPHDHGHLPLDFEWEWKDLEFNNYSTMLTGQIAVQSLDDSRHGQPQVVYATNWIANGNMITAQGDNIMAGGHKGDQAIIGGGGVSLKSHDLGSASVGHPGKPKPVCPHCGREVAEDDKFCNYCGNPL